MRRAKLLALLLLVGLLLALPAALFVPGLAFRHATAEVERIESDWQRLRALRDELAPDEAPDLAELEGLLQRAARAARESSELPLRLGYAQPLFEREDVPAAWAAVLDELWAWHEQGATPAPPREGSSAPLAVERLGVLVLQLASSDAAPSAELAFELFQRALAESADPFLVHQGLALGAQLILWQSYGHAAPVAGRARMRPLAADVYVCVLQSALDLGDALERAVRGSSDPQGLRADLLARGDAPLLRTEAWLRWQARELRGRLARLLLSAQKPPHDLVGLSIELETIRDAWDGVCLYEREFALAQHALVEAALDVLRDWP